MVDIKKNVKKRFLRDGVLDSMIEQIKVYDKKSWTHNDVFLPSFASILQLFQLNRFILKQIESQIETIRNDVGITRDELIHIASHLQDGLRNTFHGLQEECQRIILTDCEQ
jgi:hypothetical protein